MRARAGWRGQCEWPRQRAPVWIAREQARPALELPGQNPGAQERTKERPSPARRKRSATHCVRSSARAFCSHFLARPIGSRWRMRLPRWPLIGISPQGYRTALAGSRSTTVGTWADAPQDALQEASAASEESCPAYPGVTRCGLFSEPVQPTALHLRRAAVFACPEPQRLCAFFARVAGGSAARPVGRRSKQLVGNFAPTPPTTSKRWTRPRAPTSRQTRCLACAARTRRTRYTPAAAVCPAPAASGDLRQWGPRASR